MMAANCPEILSGLKFRENQQIINAVATTPPEDIRKPLAPLAAFSQIIPLPSIKMRYGPIAAYPVNTLLHELLSPLGTVIFVNTVDDIRTMQAMTALIATFYDVLHSLTFFAEDEGLGRDQAISFISAFFRPYVKIYAGPDLTNWPMK